MKRVGSRSLARLRLHGNIRLTKTCAHTGVRDRRLYHVVTSAVYAPPFVLLFFFVQALLLMFSAMTPAKRFCLSASAACLSIIGGKKILKLKKKGA